MGRKVDLFRALPPSPSTPSQCGTPPSPSWALPCDTDTHINAHTLWPASPLRNRGGREGRWVSPDYLSRFQQMVEELSSWDHTAHLSSLPYLKNPTSPPPPPSKTIPLSPLPRSSKFQDQKPFFYTIPFPKCWTRPPRPSCGSLAESRTLEQTMPSDFLTPFLELDEEFCKVRVSKNK